MATPTTKTRFFSFLRAVTALVAVFALMSLTVGIPTPAKGGGTGWCTDYEGNNFECYDDSDYDDGGYGGGGCASYDESYYDNSYSSGPSYVGEYHSEHPNVVWNGENWVPADGYEWVTDDIYDYSVQPLYGTFHSTHPNVWWDGTNWVPESGFEWASDDTYDFTVQRVYGSAHPDYANVVWSGDGWSPVDGYVWASDDPDDYSVVSAEPSYGDAHPDEANVWWNGSGWEPADGYTWANEDANNYSVVEVGPEIGDAHPDSENVFWTGSNWLPADGYTWLNDEAGDYRAIPIEETVPEELDVETANAVPMLSESVSRLESLHINEVPSPAGYKSESERRAQLAALSDQHIEDQLAHIQRTMAALGKDFRADSAELQAWYEDSRQAEDDALMASFSLLIGASLDDDFPDVWSNFPKMKFIASNGMRVLSLGGAAQNLAKDFSDPSANRAALAAYMGELTTQLHNFDPELISKTGTKVVSLASFFIDYTYQAAKWSVSRDQIHMITNNLDKPNGRLEAQKSLSQLQEDLFEERARRAATG